MLVNSDSKFKKGDTITLKNILGEEIIATYISDNSTHYTITDPVALGMSSSGMQFMPPVVSGNLVNEIELQKAHIMWAVPTDEQIVSSYTQAVSGIAVPSKQKIIV